MRKVNFTSAIVFAACASLLVPLAASGPYQLTGSSRFQPGSDEVTARITRRIDALSSLFRPGASVVASDTFIDSLIDGDVRAELFRLESLLRLYRHHFENLNEHLRQVKAVEDGLGAYTYTVDSLNFAKDRFKRENQSGGANSTPPQDQEKVLEELEQKRQTAHGVLAKLLERSTLGSDLRSLRSQVGPSFRGWGTAKNVPYVKQELQQMLKRVRDDKYDFNKLEDGIHEFRRQLRWFPMTIDALDGLIMIRDEPAGKCPIPALEPLADSAAARNKYSNPSLRFPSPHPCTVSRCLLWEVSKTIRDLGRLKDDAQGELAVEFALDDDLDVTAGSAATPDQAAHANAIRSQLNSSHALDSLMTQLSSCKA